MKWICDNCGREHELDIEDLYLERLVKDARLEISRVTCPVCATGPCQFTYEEGLRLFKLLANTNKEVITELKP